MMYGYGVLNNHVPTLRAAMKGGGSSPLITSLYAVYKAESNANDSLVTYNGTAQGGLTYTAGKSGNAFTSNGTNAYVSFSTDAFNGLTSDFSVSLWCNIAGSRTDNVSHYFLANSKAPTWFSNPGGFNISCYNNTLQIDIFDKTNVNGILTFTDYGSVIQRGTWQMYTFTRSGNIYTIYVNGTQVAQSTITIQPIFYSGSTTPSIFCFINNGVLRYAGTNGTKYDEFNIWNKSLTSTEITQLYNTGTGKFYPY